MTKDYVITLPYLTVPVGMNSRASRFERAAQARELRAACAVLARKLKIPRLRIATIGLVSYVGNAAGARSGFDPDNITATLKHCIDGLRDARVLAEDHGRIVRETWQRVIPFELDPYRRERGALILHVHDAADDPPVCHYPPGRIGELTSVVLHPRSEEVV